MKMKGRMIISPNADVVLRKENISKRALLITGSAAFGLNITFIQIEAQDEDPFQRICHRVGMKILAGEGLANNERDIRVRYTFRYLGSGLRRGSF
ncbi:hypothetical protein ATR1_017c0017 [Acetobacter tropicalis]|nr:hypothetical protein ATR1_017c0017 [Acetobacter tropicalis]